MRTAYRTAAKKHHPDRFPSYIQKLAATRRMQELNAAYAVLRDPAQKRAYDLRIGQQAFVDTGPEARTGAAASRPSTASEDHLRRGWREPENVWLTIVWLASAAGYLFISWDEGKAQSSLDLVLQLAAALVIGPMLLMVVLVIVALPLMVVGMAFGDSFRSRVTTGSKNLAVDLAWRVAALGLVGLVGYQGFRIGFMPDLLFIGLLAAGGGLLGEISAMIVYIYKRQRTLRESLALAALDT